MDLSVLIPARNEQFLRNTVEDILANLRADTEIIAVLDGCWADPPLVQHERVTVLRYPESIGQRAATNRAAEIARGRYVMKCDAHCAFDEGFDAKMLAVMEDDITMVPVMRNLHVFNWKCANCGMEVYQGPKPDKCRNETCTFDEQKFELNVVWIAKTNPQSSAYRLNKNLQFKYFPELRDRQPRTGLAETMSLQGSCFLCTREKYWELGLCDETWGSWGQQGTEVALKTWLSGGRVLCNMDTWYAHLFRTQPGFSHPFPDPGASQKRAREISQALFLNDRWEKAVHPLSWLLEKFWEPLMEVKDNEARWTEDDLTALKSQNQNFRLSQNGVRAGIVYYTDNRLDPLIMRACHGQLTRAAGSRPIVSVSLAPLDFGRNIVIEAERGYLTMFRQILAGLEVLDTDYAFLAEHDILYHPSHFDFTPPRDDTYYYNTHTWKVRYPDGHALHYFTKQTSGLCANRKLLVEHYRKRVAMVEAGGFSRKMGFEPGSHHRAERVDDYGSEAWQSDCPNIDIRHDRNLTSSRWDPSEFRDQRNCREWQEAHSVASWYEAGGFVELLEGLG